MGLHPDKSAKHLKLELAASGLALVRTFSRQQSGPPAVSPMGFVFSDGKCLYHAVTRWKGSGGPRNTKNEAVSTRTSSNR